MATHPTDSSPLLTPGVDNLPGVEADHTDPQNRRPHADRPGGLLGWLAELGNARRQAPATAVLLEEGYEGGATDEDERQGAWPEQQLHGQAHPDMVPYLPQHKVRTESIDPADRLPSEAAAFSHAIPVGRGVAIITGSVNARRTVVRNYGLSAVELSMGKGAESAQYGAGTGFRLLPATATFVDQVVLEGCYLVWCWCDPAAGQGALVCTFSEIDPTIKA